MLIGSGLLVTIWAPLAASVGALARAFPHWGISAAAAMVAASLALAATGAGYLALRFGRRASFKHAVGGGLLGAAELWAMGLLGNAYGSTLVGLCALLSLSALSAAFCALGGHLARRGKLRS